MSVKIGFLSHSAMSVYYFRMPIIRALLARGDEVFIITPNDDFVPKLRALNLPFKITTYELSRSSVNPLIVCKNFFSLRNTLKSLKLDLLQSAAHKSNTLGLIAAKSVGIKHCVALVEGLGSFYIDEDFKTSLVRFGIELLYKISFQIANKFIFVSRANQEFFENLGLKKAKSELILSVGINLKHFFPLKISTEQRQEFIKKNDLKPNLPIVLMIARALWHKGVREFYEAGEILKNEANFIFVGGYDDNKSSANLPFLQSGSVRYLGSRDDINFLLNLCDIFVLPSYKEGYPRTILEAKACAKPCVVSEVEGCTEAVREGLDGLFCEVKNSKDLAEKIQILLDDEPLRLNLGANAFKDALNYDEKVISEKYLALYDNLLRG